MTPEEKRIVYAAIAWRNGTLNGEAKELVEAVNAYAPVRRDIADELRQHAKKNTDCCADPELYLEAANEIERLKIALGEVL